MNKLNFNEVLPTEELLPAEMEAVVGGSRKVTGTIGFHCGCGNGSGSDTDKEQ